MFSRGQKLFGLAAFALAVTLALLLGIKPLRAADPVCNGVSCYLLQTTTNDFVRGEFYATGLRKLGDGEVQLLPVGLSTPWQATTALPAARAELALVSYNNILYAIGGFDGANYHTEIYSATTSLVGDINVGWVKTDDLPAERAGAAAVIAFNPDPILYVVGGGTGGSPSNTIYYKKIAANGTLSGSWGTATLPVNLIFSGAVVRGSNLYVIGGGSLSSDVIYRIPIQNSNGDLGTPVEDLPLPEALRALGAATWYDPTNDFLYVLGGLTTGGTATENVYYTFFKPDGTLDDSGPVSGWHNTSLVDAFAAQGVVQYNGAIYVIGGKQGIASSTAITKVQTALIDPDGSLHNWGGGVGNWIVTEPLPVPRFFHGSTANQGGELFIAGGYDASGNAKAQVYHGSTTGAASTYAPNGTFTSDVMDVGPSQHMQAIKWNASVDDTSKMSLTIYYRTANTLGALANETWTLGGVSGQSSDGITNTLTFQSPINHRYLQYRADFATTLSDKSPRLNAFELDYAGDATPTFTPTSTATVTPFPTDTPTLSPTTTSSPTATSNTTVTPTATETATSTATPTSTAHTPTATRSLTPSMTPTVCAGKPDVANLVSPSNGSKIKAKKVPLAWDAARCAQKYVVIVKKDKKKGKAFKKFKNVTATVVNLKKLPAGHTYYWRVKACNGNLCAKGSPWWNFKRIGKSAAPTADEQRNE